MSRDTITYRNTYLITRPGTPDEQRIPIREATLRITAGTDTLTAAFARLGAAATKIAAIDRVSDAYSRLGFTFDGQSVRSTLGSLALLDAIRDLDRAATGRRLLARKLGKRGHRQ